MVTEEVNAEPIMAEDSEPSAVSEAEALVEQGELHNGKTNTVPEQEDLTEKVEIGDGDLNTRQDPDFSLTELDKQIPAPEPLPNIEKSELANGTPKPLTDSERVKLDGSLIRKSKRIERQRKKQAKKSARQPAERRSIFDLPFELVMTILADLLPSDLIRLSRVNKSMKEFISQQEASLTREIIRSRYATLEKCLRLPVLLEDVGDDEARAALLRPERLTGFVRKQAYSHVLTPDPEVVCTCLTCVLRWNSLCLAVDFAHWQGNLDKGEPIPMFPRGTNPEWNRTLLQRNAGVVLRALREPLWYAVVLERHLESTVGSIRRHSANKGNRRRRFRMTREDERVGTDGFLERSGPPTMDFPFHRDNYYMLEAYLPNRGWNGDEERWMYMPASQHDTDVGMVVMFYRQKMETERAEKEERERLSSEGHGTEGEKTAL